MTKLRGDTRPASREQDQQKKDQGLDAENKNDFRQAASYQSAGSLNDGIDKSRSDTGPQTPQAYKQQTRHSLAHCKTGDAHTGHMHEDKKSRNRGDSVSRAKAQNQSFKHNTSLKNEDGNVYAALDLGTNNCRLLIARPTRRGFLVIDAFSRIIRLGEGLTHSGMLSEAAIRRTIEALTICAQKIRTRGVHKSRLIATEACRIAANCDAFLERVRQETGLSLEVISRETEASLAVAGCASLLDKEADWALIFDIGGGSTELICLDLSKRKRVWRKSLYDRLDAQNCIVGWTSLPVGVVTLADKFGGCDVNETVFEDMVQEVMVPLRAFERDYQISDKLKHGRVHLLGTSGTVTTVAGIHLGLDFYDRSKVDGIWLAIDDVRTVSQMLLQLSYEERVAQPCIGIERADLVLAGCAILEALIRFWPTEQLRIADRGLREGVLAMLMAEDGVAKGRGTRHPYKRKS